MTLRVSALPGAGGHAGRKRFLLKCSRGSRIQVYIFTKDVYLGLTVLR